MNNTDYKKLTEENREKLFTVFVPQVHEKIMKAVSKGYSSTAIYFGKLSAYLFYLDKTNYWFPCTRLKENYKIQLEKEYPNCIFEDGYQNYCVLVSWDK